MIKRMIFEIMNISRKDDKEHNKRMIYEIINM